MSRAAVIAIALLAIVGARAEDTPVRDPMRPFDSVAAAAVAASAPRFVLTGLLIAPSRRVAIVNGRPYTQGEAVDGAEIIAIEPNAVRLREHGTETVVLLSRPAERRPPILQGETVP